MATPLQLQVSAACPSRATANLRVLQATGNLPKTVPHLAAALRPFSSQLVLLSPSQVLKTLGSGVTAKTCANETNVPLSLRKTSPKPAAVALTGTRAHTTASPVLSFQYLDREELKPNGKIMDQRGYVRARATAMNRNAILVEVCDENDLDSISEQLKGELLRKKARAKPQSSVFPTRQKLESYLVQKCIGGVVEVDPSKVVTQLRDLQLISGSASTNGITYSASLGELLNAALENEEGPETTIEPREDIRSPTPVVEDPSMEVEVSNSGITEARMLSANVALRQDPVLLAAVKCIRKWGSDLPKTEQKLANALKPTCKVIHFCKPTKVLQRLGKSSKFFVSQEKTLELSFAGLFEAPSQPGVQDDYLAKFQAKLLSQAHRSNSSIEYITEDQKNDKLLHTVVERVKEWVTQRQCRFKEVATVSSPSSEGVDGSEPMVLASEAHSSLSTASSPSGSPFTTKANLISEFFQLCVTHTHVNPGGMVRGLAAQSIIDIGEDGSVSYTGIPKAPPACEDIIRQCLELERAVIEREVAGGETRVQAKTGKRKSGRQGRKVYKRLHLT